LTQKKGVKILPSGVILKRKEIENLVILEIAANIHSPFSPYIADFLA
jgi:hypothetical protein